METQNADLAELLEAFHLSLKNEPLILRLHRRKLVGEEYDRLINDTQDPDTRAALMYNRESFFKAYVR